MVLHPDLSSGLLKVVSSFHLSQSTVLPTFFPNPEDDSPRALHILDVHRAILFLSGLDEMVPQRPSSFCGSQGTSSFQLKGFPNGFPPPSRFVMNWLVSSYLLLREAHSTRSNPWHSSAGSPWVTFAVQRCGPHHPPLSLTMQWVSGPITMLLLDSVAVCLPVVAFRRVVSYV